MAGGVLISSSDKKRQAAVAAARSGQETFRPSTSQKNTTPVNSPESRPKFSLSGVLFGPEKSNKKPTESKKSFSGEFLPSQNLAKEQQFLIDLQNKVVRQEIEQILHEIKTVTKQLKDVGQEVTKTILNPPIEVNEYQRNFILRMRQIVEFIRKNISSAREWQGQFSQKSKKKQNMFWNKAKDKKKGGQAYMESGEHSASRSVN